MPWQHVLCEVDPSATFLLWQVDSQRAGSGVIRWRESGVTVRAVRGRKMRTVEALFNELAAALQFPQYFGENWPALDECLSDMEWLAPCPGFAIVVSQPEEVLADSADPELGVLVRILRRAAATYAEPIELGEWWDRPAIPFHVVLAAPSGEAENSRRRWTGSGALIRDLDQ